jgi:hypothetical protein
LPVLVGPRMARTKASERGAIGFECGSVRAERKAPCGKSPDWRQTAAAAADWSFIRLTRSNVSDRSSGLPLLARTFKAPRLESARWQANLTIRRTTRGMGGGPYKDGSCLEFTTLPRALW